MNNILAIGAHPDDIELGCAGTLAKFKEMGSNIILLIMTNGENWEQKNKEIRIMEQHLSLEKLLPNKVYWMNLTDGNLKINSNLISKIEQIILDHNIDIVFANYENDTHQDHVELSKIVKSASRFSDNIFFYESITSIGFEPNMYIDISNQFELKKDVINCFKSQIKKYSKRKINLINLIEYKSKLHGFKYGCSNAEGFVVKNLKLDKLFYNLQIQSNNNDIQNKILKVGYM